MSTIKKPIVKKEIQGMYPVKKWLTVDEACSFLNISINLFRDVAATNNLTVSQLAESGKKGRYYYKVLELENILEQNIFQKKIL